MESGSECMGPCTDLLHAHFPTPQFSPHTHCTQPPLLHCIPHHNSLPQCTPFPTAHTTPSPPHSTPHPPRHKSASQRHTSQPHSLFLTHCTPCPSHPTAYLPLHFLPASPPHTLQTRGAASSGRYSIIAGHLSLIYSP